MCTRGDSRTESGLAVGKKPYVAPSLTEYGGLKNLTAAGSRGMEGQGKDGGDFGQKP